MTQLMYLSVPYGKIEPGTMIICENCILIIVAIKFRSLRLGERQVNLTTFINMNDQHGMMIEGSKTWINATRHICIPRVDSGKAIRVEIV